jgi:hypothetical protein
VLVPFDEQGTSAQDWQIDGWPVLFLVNEDGVIIQRHLGNDYPGGLIEVLQEAIW